MKNLEIVAILNQIDEIECVNKLEILFVRGGNITLHGLAGKHYRDRNERGCHECVYYIPVDGCLCVLPTRENRFIISVCAWFSLTLSRSELLSSAPISTSDLLIKQWKHIDNLLNGDEREREN